MPSFVLPGLADPDVAELREVAIAGGRIWTDTPRASGRLELIPDLSHDIVLAGVVPTLISRTTRCAAVPVVRGGQVTGVRLPIAATDIRVNPAWDGWRAAGEDPESRLAAAIGAGAITWREDPLIAAMVELCNRPGARVASIASALATSPRNLTRRSAAVLGASPVLVLRVLRLWRLIDEVRRAPVAQAAAEAGYADQSHALRDVRSLTGMTVGRLARFRLAR